jgi:hypothetical protein
VHRLYILLSITNMMQHHTTFFIAVNALRVSGGFFARHQELKTVHTASGICQACLLLAVAASRLDIYASPHQTPRKNKTCYAAASPRYAAASPHCHV